MICHKSPISAIDSFQDYIATAGYDNMVILWNKRNKEAISCSYHDHLVNSCSFSNCGHFLITGSSDYTARLWSIPELKLINVYPSHDDDVDMVKFSSDDKFIATVSHDKSLRLFKTSGELIHRFTGHLDTIHSVEWTSNNERLITSGDDGTIRIWDIPSKKMVKKLNFEGVQTDSVTISNNIIFAGNDSGDMITVEIINSNIEKFNGHTAGIKTIKFNKDNTLIVSCGYDYQAIIWEVKGAKLKKRFTVKCPELIWLRSVCWLNNNELAFGTFGSSYAIYDISKEKWDLNKVNNTKGVNCIKNYDGINYSIGDCGNLIINKEVKFKANFLCNFLLKVGSSIIVGGLPGKLVNLSSDKTILEYKSPLNCAVAYENNNKSYYFIGSYTGELLLFDEKKHKLLNEIKIHSNAIKSLVINNNILFTLCSNGDCNFYSLPSLTLLKSVNNAHGQIANDGATLMDDKFVSVGRDKMLLIWDKNFNTLKIKTPHSHSVKCVSTSKDGKHILTGAYDGKVGLYNLSLNSWKMIKYSNSGISSICFDEILQLFQISSYNGSIYQLTP